LSELNNKKDLKDIKINSETNLTDLVKDNILDDEKLKSLNIKNNFKKVQQ
jgi:hypothetical protein